MATATTQPEQSADERSAEISGYYAETRRDPVGWCQRALGMRFWSKQKAVLRAIAANEFVAVQSCNSGGKTHLAGAVAIWAAHAFYPYRVMLTGANWESIEEQLWPTIHEIRENMPYRDLANLGRPLKTKWNMGGRSGIFSISPDRVESGGGWHERNGTMFIVDEASGLERAEEEAILGCLASGEHSRLLLIGNPLHPSGQFYEACEGKDQALYAKVKISAFDCPALTGREPEIPGLATQQHVERFKAKYGEDSAAYKARVLGEFPDDSDDQLIPLTWLERAKGRRVDERVAKGLEAMAGVDVARSEAGQGDKCVFQPIVAGAALPPHTWSERDLTVTAHRVMELCHLYSIRPERVKVDDTGVGGGVTDYLHRQGWPVQRITAGGMARDKVSFANQRMEGAWALRLAIDKWLSLPSDETGDENIETLMGDLSAYRTHEKGPTPSGQMRLEPKETMQKRIGRSPDRGDALTYAVYDPPVDETQRGTWDARAEFLPAGIIPELGDA
jgi:hypothetical protein